MASRFLKYSLLSLVIFFWFPQFSLAVSPPIPAQPAQRVMDLAGIIDPATRARLNARLKELEEKTTAQVVVLTLRSLEGESLEEFSHRTAVQWKIGQKGKDNGVLITVALVERKYRIEVGYGLEAVLPDSLVGSIGRERLAPHFRKGDYAGGISDAVAGIAQIIESGAQTPPGQSGRSPATSDTEATDWTIFLWVAILPFLWTLSLFLAIVFIFVLLWVVIKSMSRSRPGASGGGFWWGGSGGGGFGGGGGGDGGFSGGGGDFGGGGASGDW